MASRDECIDYWLKDGNLIVSPNRYGNDSSECATYAWRVVWELCWEIAKPLNDWPLDTNLLDRAMSMVVNDDPAVARMMGRTDLLGE
ncbi:hypothetical protein [Mycobacterium sp. E3339]|uniref:hypothetical protein n=1 Tax=Mycobacterium sp. E3339 TaxID=1834146 RepID=UPI0008017D4D|nr:hypothetical protein [Mycobacterium sp. E3339]OBG69760.1 hypothetical protein A5702_11730 [Mycobacterium sp. E3339]